jgi:hypothetical protein
MLWAFIAYGLLLISLFTAGLSGFVGLIVAYDRKAQSGPVPATHFAFQIKLFWICFVLTFAAGALGLVGLFQLLTDPVAPRPTIHGQPDTQIVGLDLLGAAPRLWPADVQTFSYHFDWRPIHPAGRALLTFWLSGLSFGAAALFSWIGPIWGMLRLAAGQPIGRPLVRL